jgi:hypothetical protein
LKSAGARIAVGASPLSRTGVAVGSSPPSSACVTASACEGGFACVAQAIGVIIVGAAAVAVRASPSSSTCVATGSSPSRFASVAQTVGVVVVRAAGGAVGAAAAPSVRARAAVGGEEVSRVAGGAVSASPVVRAGVAVGASELRTASRAAGSAPMVGTCVAGGLFVVRIARITVGARPLVRASVAQAIGVVVVRSAGEAVGAAPSIGACVAVSGVEVNCVARDASSCSISPVVGTLVADCIRANSDEVRAAHARVGAKIAGGYGPRTARECRERHRECDGSVSPTTMHSPALLLLICVSSRRAHSPAVSSENGSGGLHMLSEAHSSAVASAGRQTSRQEKSDSWRDACFTEGRMLRENVGMQWSERKGSASENGTG